MKKTRIERKLRRKTNQNLVETIIACKKNEKWLEVAHLISMPSKKQNRINLFDINTNAKNGEIVLVPGKVLSKGELEKKVKIVALGYSESAKEKLKKNKIEMSTIDEEIKKNPEAKNIHIIK
jgi:large subunit ribosomal protein L18e